MATRFLDYADIVRDRAAAQPDAVALRFQERATTYRQLDQAASQVANGLRALGLAPGARVATLDKNTDWFYEILLGAAKSGQVLVPVNYRLAPPEMAAIINDAGAAVLFVGEEYLPVVERLLPELPTVRQVVALSGRHPDEADYQTWRDSQIAEDPRLPTQPDEVVLQLYTSGTTGRPKGVQLTHANLVAALEASGEWTHATTRDVNLVCLPQYHIAGALGASLGLIYGARNVIAREINPADLLKLIAGERVTMGFFAPAVLLFMLQDPTCRDTDFSSLRLILYGASPIPLDLLRDALATFRCGFGQVYGMTETTGVVTYLPSEQHDPRGTPRMRSCGRPIATAEVKVVDESDNERPSGEVGEIVCRSPQNTRGYWNLPNETAQTLRGGWLHTGDAGYFDADGYLYIYDRIKDMIVSGGENVYPAEVESALFGHPAVADVGVIGVPDDRWGEAVKAIVVRAPGSNVSAEELIAYARQRIAGYKLPKSVDFVDALPRNASGKILKRVLRAPYWEGQERQVN